MHLELHLILCAGSMSIAADLSEIFISYINSIYVIRIIQMKHVGIFGPVPSPGKSAEGP
jgi:hypothetical protein